VQITYFLSLIFTLILTPFITRLSSYFGLLEKPDARKRHSRPTASLGGIAICSSFLLSVFLIEIFSSKLLDVEDLLIPNKDISIFFLGLITYFLIGLLDDLYRLSPWPRLVGQIIIAAIMWFLGLKIENYEIFFEFNLNHLTSFLITIFWIVGVTNAINWLDGLDGLASRFASISFVGISIIAINNNNIGISIISSILAGSCIGFLHQNSYPAKIFMGDSGSFLIGFSLACLSIMGCSNYERNIDLIPAILILLIPILDMSIVILQRLLQKKSPFYPDRSHFHYKLIDLGLTQNQVSSIYFSTNLTLILIYVYLAKINFSYNLIIFTVILNLFFSIKPNLKLYKGH